MCVFVFLFVFLQLLPKMHANRGYFIQMECWQYLFLTDRPYVGEKNTFSIGECRSVSVTSYCITVINVVMTCDIVSLVCGACCGRHDKTAEILIINQRRSFSLFA